MGVKVQHQKRNGRAGCSHQGAESHRQTMHADHAALALLPASPASFSPEDSTLVPHCSTCWCLSCALSVKRCRTRDCYQPYLPHTWHACRTKVVAAVHVSNLLGEVLDVAAMVQAVQAQAPNAHTVVDGVAYAPHMAIDVAAWGVDWCAAQALLPLHVVECSLECILPGPSAQAHSGQLLQLPSSVCCAKAGDA